MTIPFWCLLIAALLPQLPALIGDVLRKRQFGSIDNHDPRGQSAALIGVGARAVAAQQNAWEALPVFAAAVFVAHLSGADPKSAAIASIVFVIARNLHILFYLRNQPTLRSASFLVGISACLWLFGLAALAPDAP